MRKYFALVAEGASATRSDGLSKWFTGLNRTMEVTAEDKVEAFLKIYRELAEIHSDITAIRLDGKPHLLGFSDEEWGLLRQADVRIREGLPDGPGVQIQMIRDTPIY